MKEDNVTGVMARPIETRRSPFQLESGAGIMDVGDCSTPAVGVISDNSLTLSLAVLSGTVTASLLCSSLM